MNQQAFQDKANFIWQVADDILRGTWREHEYGDVTLPFVVLRRLDCVLRDQKEAVLAAHEQFKDKLDPDQLEQVILGSTGGLSFFNVSRFDLERLTDDANNVEVNFNAYINGFSANVREILANYNLERITEKLAKNDLLFLMCDKFTEVDLHPARVSNHEMGSIFEELLRRFSEMSNETAGEHYTPREVIRLMVRLLFAEHERELEGEGVVRSVFDPACGTGGMLTIAKEQIQEVNPGAEVLLFGQELNDQTYAIARSDFLVTGEDPNNIRLGSSFSQDRFRGQRFDYMLSNPPFGVSWKKEKGFIEEEAASPHGRFSAGTPRVSDGALLFLQHMISKMEPRGSRLAIVFNGSPLFTGDAGSGESEIRRWIIENDWLEAIVALPTEMFYNTGIATYLWIVTNRKPERRRGKVQLVDASGIATKMRKSLGNKRNYLTDAQIEEVVGLYAAFEEGERVRIFDNEDFGYTKVRVERPERTKKGEIKRDKSGEPKPDGKLRDYERVPLKEDVDAYFEREVRPHVPDAWMDRSADRVGYEINFTRYFYRYEKLRSVEEITKDILALDAETEGMLREVLAL
ncbi:MAG TPA: class I SAM-dependent DNA methyltransferase [Longimicrobiaceae bacterium]|nr:class I SAM-dependent DNA methyltransferase [Longimicrobiaceae bacterium]